MKYSLTAPVGNTHPVEISLGNVYRVLHLLNKCELNLIGNSTRLHLFIKAQLTLWPCPPKVNYFSKTSFHYIVCLSIFIIDDHTALMLN